MLKPIKQITKNLGNNNTIYRQALVYAKVRNKLESIFQKQYPNLCRFLSESKIEVQQYNQKVRIRLKSIDQSFLTWIKINKIGLENQIQESFKNMICEIIVIKD